ncbi:MAG: glycosyltransferase family 87 protein [Phycisphaerales bacterium]
MVSWLHSKHPLRLALILWAVYALAVCVIVARDPLTREVTSAYRFGSRAFFTSQDMYPRGLHGWLYPPHSAVALWPFALSDGSPIIPIELGWRLLGIGALCLATWQLWRRLVAAPAPREPPVWRGLPQSALHAAPLFLFMSAVAMITAAGSSRTGQVNSLLGASFVLCALALADRLWWRAAAFLGVAFAIKPQALPLMLVAGVLYPPFAWRMAVVSLALLALPWLRGDWSYVWQQHIGWFVKMRDDATPEPGTWADICGLLVPALKWLGIDVPTRGWTMLRALMAPITLGACWWLTRAAGAQSEGGLAAQTPSQREGAGGGRVLHDDVTAGPSTLEAGHGAPSAASAAGVAGAVLPSLPTPQPPPSGRGLQPPSTSLERVRAAFMVLTLCTTYIMLFNPRTEGNTYAVFGPVAGTVAAIALRERRWSLSAVCVLACVGLMFSRELTLNVTNFWVRPLAAIVICGGAVILARGWAKAARGPAGAWVN